MVVEAVRRLVDVFLVAKLVLYVEAVAVVDVVAVAVVVVPPTLLM